MGSNPGLTQGQIPTPAQWNSYFAAKQDDLGAGFTPISTLGGTFSGKVNFTTTASAAALSLIPGTAPLTTVNGDVWETTVGLFCQINNIIIGPITGSVGGGLALGALGVNNGLLRLNGSLGGSASSFATIAATGSIGGIAFSCGTAGTVSVLSRGLAMGTATDQGIGTVNVSVGVFLNNSAYTNPDYVLEKEFTGKIERFAGNPGASTYVGRPPLADLREHIRTHLRLPRVTDRPADIFERADILLEKMEEMTLYVLELEERIRVLESRP